MKLSRTDILTEDRDLVMWQLNQSLSWLNNSEIVTFLKSQLQSLEQEIARQPRGDIKIEGG
jgi:hypothetical protein